ncbi:hypothetical protein ACGF8B_39985 [Streptomyces sp. NPDC047917]|uniref:hypothetical protein n=1 Tax=Streptomyces sp. NPDC047917 TaxID=3365491 RepID=UPI00371FE48D
MAEAGRGDGEGLAGVAILGVHGVDLPGGHGVPGRVHLVLLELAVGSGLLCGFGLPARLVQQSRAAVVDVHRPQDVPGEGEYIANELQQEPASRQRLSYLSSGSDLIIRRIGEAQRLRVWLVAV